MIVIIAGCSHTGKTLLAQRLMEQYHYPYLSIDHLKMGLIRSGQTTLTPEDDDQLTEYLWPIVREIIKTAIENKQDLIVEGCYIPYDYKQGFTGDYLAFINYICLIFSEDYIEQHYEDIIQYEHAIEQRVHWDYPKDLMIQENKQALAQCKEHNVEYLLIDQQYDVDFDPDIVWRSERLVFKRIKDSDVGEIAKMLQDQQVMYAWEHDFTDEDVSAWVKKRRELYKCFGYDYFLAVHRQTKQVVGQIGLLNEPVNGEEFTGLGYILKKEYWNNGYGTEGARAMLDYGFHELGKEEIIATIRPENKSSGKVAERLGMEKTDGFVKVHNGKEMPHLIYRITTGEYNQQAEEEHHD